MKHPYTLIHRWHKKFKFHDEPMDLQKLNFRMSLQSEEHDELADAIQERNAEEVVDALIDTIWIAYGTLDLLGVDVEKALLQVYDANMAKKRGVKPGREQSGGFDVIKPEGWTGPDHSDNHGKLDEIFKA